MSRWRASYTLRMLRTWRANRPSSMNRAIAACVASGECQSARNFAARRDSRSDGGATRKPSRSVGSIVLENEPT